MAVTPAGAVISHERRARKRKAPLPAAPSVGRPAQGFGTARAERWVLGAALIIAMTYAFRRLVEPSVAAAPPRGGKLAALTGAGKPPPGLAHWAVAYGAGFTMLSILALGAPEVAASLAMLMVAGSLLTNGTTIAADIGGLEGNAPLTLPAPGGQPGAQLKSLGELAPAHVPGQPLPTLKVPGQ